MKGLFEEGEEWDDMPKYSIYKVTNNITGLSYVGQHIVKDESLLRYMGGGILIKQAVKEYGKENFSKEILEVVEDDTDDRRYSSERERYWIKVCGTMHPDGYNLAPGGIGGCTPEAAAKIVAVRRKNGTNRHSSKTRKKMSEAKMGVKFTEEHKQHLSDHHHNKMKRVLVFEDGHKEETTESLVKIAKRLGMSPNTLIRHSAKNEFKNGVMIEGVSADKYQCCQNPMCFDPISGDRCSMDVLYSRKRKQPDLYSHVVVKNQVI